VQRDRGLKPRFYYILLALAGADRHGLGIAREVASLSDGQVKLWPATLYGSLDELCGVGWIEEIDDPRRRRADESDKHRIFRLTAAGRRTLSTETGRLSDLLRVAQRRLNAKPGSVS
jgi:DNA-binding PadR family transcriptional regulator